MSEVKDADPWDLIPNVANDVALLCLAKLPPRARAVARCVSRSWRNALSNPSSLRHYLNIPLRLCIFVALFETEYDPGYVRATQDNTRWSLLDPHTLRTVSLPNPLSGISTATNLKAVAVNGELFLPEIPALVNSRIVGFRSYSVEEGRWRAVPPIPESRGLCACAGLGNFVYLSGGRMSASGEASTRACRYDTVKNRWEPLPDMMMARVDPAGFVMDGKFFVVGGCHSSSGFCGVHPSGEFYDPATRRWTLLPNLWGNGLRYVEEFNGTHPAVAVVGNTLYTMQSHCNELMRFDPSKEWWIHVGYVAGRFVRDYRVRYILIGVKEEVWVMEYAMGRDIRIHAWRPEKGSESGKWTPIEVEKFEGFDHVLACTTCSV